MERALGEFGALVAAHAAIPRPWYLAEVLDTGRYAATGGSWVAVTLGGKRVEVAYRDGPMPEIGALVQVRRASSRPDSWWLALPLPQPAGACGQFYVSGQSLTDGTWDVIRCDPGVGAVWQHRSDHPLGAGGYPRRPLLRASDNGETLPNSNGLHATPNRLFTWGTALDHSGPGELFYSDDNAATWTGTGQNISQLGNADGDDGRIFATDGSDILHSTDGVSWASVGAGPGGTVRDVWAVKSGGLDQIFAYTTTGLWSSLHLSGAVFGGWNGPWTPGAGSVGYVHEDPLQLFFDGTSYYERSSGTPGAGTFLESLAGRYTAGAGHFFPAIYDIPDHPEALDVPIAGHALASPGAGYAEYCQIFGLDDSDAANTRYIGRPDGTTDTYTILDSRQASDLGALYLPSPDGLSH